jgi:flagellar motor component MotA
MTLYVLVSGVVGRLSYLADKMDGNTIKDADNRDKLSRRAEMGWFAAEHFFTLGLLGTVFGLCLATSTNLNEEAQVSDIVAGLKMGLNTAFYTTICGIIFSLPLQVQLMILRFKLEE